MKKLLLLAAIALIVPSAQAALLATILDTGTPVEIEVVAGASNHNSTAVMLSWVKGGKLALVDSFSVLPGATHQASYPKLPKSVSRLIVEVDLPTVGTATIRLTQGPRLEEYSVANEGHLVGHRLLFDVLSP